MDSEYPKWTCQKRPNSLNSLLWLDFTFELCLCSFGSACRSPCSGRADTGRSGGRQKSPGGKKNKRGNLFHQREAARPCDGRCSSGSGCSSKPGLHQRITERCSGYKSTKGLWAALIKRRNWPRHYSPVVSWPSYQCLWSFLKARMAVYTKKGKFKKRRRKRARMVHLMESLDQKGVCARTQAPELWEMV